MSLIFVLDENLRGPLSKVIERRSLRGGTKLDVVHVGDLPELPLGISDWNILSWASENNRILVTEDRATMKNYFEQFRQQGHDSPGVFILKPASSITEVVDFLILAEQASESVEWENACHYIPF